MAIITKRSTKVDQIPTDNAPRIYSLAAQIKARTSFRKLLKDDGHEVRVSGLSAKCCCPFHPDKTPSFSIYPSDTGGHCFGCDWKGDIFDYEMKAHGVSFAEALARVDGRRERIKRESPPAPVVLIRMKKKSVSEAHRADQKRYAQRIATDAWIQERVSTLRVGDGHKWKPDTLAKLGAEGSLGWAGDALAFIYRTGTKYRRWPYRDFKWDDDNAGISLWREHRIADASQIYITEGETDAITLLDCGLESDLAVAVIATQGASSFHSSWAKSFDGKIVTLCFDDDSAGKRAETEVGDLLVDRGIEVFTSSVKGVTK
jgi:DNA primase